MALDNVAVHWPRTGSFYEPVAAAQFSDFSDMTAAMPATAGPAIALAEHVAKAATVRAGAYTELVDLLLGLPGVLYATDAAAEDEDPVIDPDGCAWIAGGLERFVSGHAEFGDVVTFDSVAGVMRAAITTGRLPEQQMKWLDNRLAAMHDETGAPPQWSFNINELSVLARFYQRCYDRGYAVFAES
jgi:hypothetical protein